jgi:Protein of unknown function (DUF3800)
MHIFYMDDSGDDVARVFSCLSIHVHEWDKVLKNLLAMRRWLREKEGIYVKVELHATDFVYGKGRISANRIYQADRCRIFNEILTEMAKIPSIRLYNAAANKEDELRLFERMLNRINTAMKKSDSHAVIVSDEGKDYSSLMRKMRVHNPVGSKYGAWDDGSITKNLTLNRVVEDLFFRKSHRSYFVQVADFAAYALLRSERPLPSKSKLGLDKSFELLRDICTPECYAKDPRKLGIIRA